MAPVTQKTPPQQGQDSSKQAEWQRNQRAGQDLREELETQALKSQREKDMHWISKELSKGFRLLAAYSPSDLMQTIR